MDDIDRFFVEDLKDEGDITSDSLFTDETSKARIIAKEKCVVAGLKVIENIFKRAGATIDIKFNDGDLIKESTVVAEISGSIKSILKAERLALNIISKMSGIATETRNLVEKCKATNEKVTIAATRKTTPGFRRYEKEAVVIGGGEAHRYGLYDSFMIKDNHIKAVGSIEEAIKRVKQKGLKKIIEVEIENEKDAITAAKMDVDVIMLDNLNPKKGKDISNKIRKINKKIIIEVSGGINPDNITDFSSYADRISLGYITHSVKAIDFSLEIV